MTRDLNPELEREIDDLFERPRVNVVTIADVKPEPVRWLWEGRVPFAGMTLWDGDPGVGKTTAALDVAARVTTGSPMPDGTPAGASGDVVILTVEDVLATTIRPRLDAAGADLRRVHAITGVPDGDGERPLTLPADWPAIIAAAEQTGAVMVYLDPLMALLGGDTNSYRDQDVRRALVPGIRAAERLGFALVVTRHLNKSGGANALYRGGGSIGIIAAARSAMLFGPDPKDDTGARRILAMTKHNLAPRARSLAYTIATVQLDNGIAPTRIAWAGSSDLLAADLLTEIETERPGSALDDAVAFLREELQGEAQPARDIEREAKAIGISSATLRRAREQLDVVVEKQGFGRDGQWRWRLPAAKGAKVLNDEQLRNKDAKALIPNNEHLSALAADEVPFIPHTQARNSKGAKVLNGKEDERLNTLVDDACAPAVERLERWLSVGVLAGVTEPVAIRPGLTLEPAHMERAIRGRLNDYRTLGGASRDLAGRWLADCHAALLARIGDTDHA